MQNADNIRVLPNMMLDSIHDCQISCEEAVNILNQLLLYDKIDSGLLELDRTNVNIKEFLQSILDPFYRQVYIFYLYINIEICLEINCFK